jgi:hypothetical protein
MSDPSLAGRLSATKKPTLVLWGDSDQIVDPDYGRAYAAAIPAARFHLLKDTGHMPQIETPDQLLHAIWDCVDTASPASAADPSPTVAQPEATDLQRQEEPDTTPVPGVCYSFRAVSGPVIRWSRGRVVAMIPREAASPARMRM